MKKSIVLLCLFTSSLFGLEAEDVTVSGAYLGLFNHIQQSDTIQSQFDYAANINFEFQFSDSITGVAQLQGGPGGGAFGLNGPEAVFTDLNITYEDSDRDMAFTFGSFDMPFGYNTERLTNNGNTSGSPFFLNNLMYTAIGGGVGTLNTLGVKGVYTNDISDFTWVVSNGTGENASNASSDFGFLVSIGKQGAFNGLLDYSLSYLNSDDQDDTSAADSYQTAFDGILFELGRQVDVGSRTIDFRTSHGSLTYDDGNSTTEDGVTVHSFEISSTVHSDVVGAFRVSMWNPEDSDNSGSGYSSDLATPGLNADANADNEVVRYQVSLTKPLQENFSVTGEGIYETYDNAADVGALLLYVSGQF